MTYAEAITFLYGLRWFGAKLGLENSFKLAELAGNPQNQLRFIHVAGTNGKGSTCAMLESIYRAAGLRVGLFTSPHLVSFRERMQVNRQLIGEADVVRLVEELRELVAGGVPPAVEPGGAPGGRGLSDSAAHGRMGANLGGMMPPSTSGGTPAATFFEFITVMALRYFAEQKCDLVIWETGLGGRLDATNIVTPLASVITNIALDHQQWLGDTLAQIAAEKAGIVKPNVPVLTAASEPEALTVIEATARRLEAPFRYVARDHASRIPHHASLPLPGEHQQLNAALALATVEVLQGKIPVNDSAIHTGLSTVHWPGRLQIVTRPGGRKILLDAAHNPAGAEVLRAALTGASVSDPAQWGSFPNHAGPEAGAPVTLILGILADKNCRAMCDVLSPPAAKIRLVPVTTERTAAPTELAAFCRAANPRADVAVCDSLAVALAQTEGDPFVVVAGSLYLIGEAMELLGLSPVPAADEKALNNWQPAVSAAR